MGSAVFLCAWEWVLAWERLSRVSNASHSVKWDATWAVVTRDFHDGDNGVEVHDGGATAAKAFMCFD